MPTTIRLHPHLDTTPGAFTSSRAGQRARTIRALRQCLDHLDDAIDVTPPGTPLRRDLNDLHAWVTTTLTDQLAKSRKAA